MPGGDTAATMQAKAPPSPEQTPEGQLRAALLVMLAGVCAALHVGKLAPAITVLVEALGMSLLQAGFLLSLVQLAGMSLGLAFGSVADALGSRRSMLTGLAVLAAASVVGAGASHVLLMMALRALEGFGFLLVVLPAPGLVRRLAPPGRASAMLGMWGGYMPAATAAALLLGPLCISALGWRAWWLLLGLLTAAMALWLARAVPELPRVPAPATVVSTARWTSRLRRTVTASGPWLVALSFAVYSGQWLAVIGFLPTIYAQAGVPAGAIGALTALAAAVNIAGNISSGQLLQRGVRPQRLLATGFAVMGLAAVATFAGASGPGLPASLRYLAVLLFSGMGGLIPGTLFALAVRVAPGEDTLGTTVGWMQQWSAAGQFLGPPLVAALAARVGGWHWTWLFTGVCAITGLVLAGLLARRLQR